MRENLKLINLDVQKMNMVEMKNYVGGIIDPLSVGIIGGFFFLLFSVGVLDIIRNKKKFQQECAIWKGKDC